MSIRPSVRSLKYLLFTLIVSVYPYDQPWPFFGLSVHPSVRLSVRLDRFPGISRRAHRGNGLQFCILIYPDHFQNWLHFGHGLLIFLLLVWLCLSENLWSNLWFPGIYQRMHGENTLEFCMLMYPHHFQSWLDFGRALLIFLIMVPSHFEFCPVYYNIGHSVYNRS